MDPVNKWLMVVIFFMAALLIIIATKAGSGRYMMMTSSIEFGEPLRERLRGKEYVIVYSIDTKTGAMKARVIDCNETFINAQNEIKKYWVDGLKPWKEHSSYRYNY